MSLSRPFGGKFEGRVSQWGNQSLKPSSSSVWDPVFLLLGAIFSFLFIWTSSFTPKSSKKPLPLLILFSSQSTRGLALVCTWVCPWQGPSGTWVVFLQEAAAGNSEARGQQERKDAHQLSQPSPAFSPLISQLLNISAGGCHSLPVWLRRWLKLQVSRDKGCHCVSDFSG